VFLEDPFLRYFLIYAKISYITMVFTDQYFTCISHLHQYVPCSIHLIPFGLITPVTPPVKDNNTMDTTEMKYDSTVVYVYVCVCVVAELQVQWLVFQPKDGNSRHPYTKPHAVTAHKTIITRLTAERTPNLTIIRLIVI
jgi:hypothetical protein